MTTISVLRANASYLPIMGPVLGFFNRIDDSKDGRLDAFNKHIYARNAKVGSALTLVTSVALAALGFSAAVSGTLFAFGAVALIYNVRVSHFYNELIKEGSDYLGKR